MAGLALFSLKDSSLLAFCGRALDHNLRSVFGLQSIPSDTQMREILDPVDPLRLRPIFNDVFRALQRGKAWGCSQQAHTRQPHTPLKRASPYSQKLCSAHVLA